MTEQDVQDVPPAMILARKLWDFLTLMVEKNYGATQSKLIQDWADTFERFFRKQKSERVIAVFDFYVKEWRKSKGFIHLSPESFIGDFTLLAQRYEWNHQPIPTKDLRAILVPLSKERWDCEWEKLIISVSQSLHNIRLFLKAVKAAEIPENIKRQLRAIYGHIQGYTTRYYLDWRNRQIEAVWTATITKEKIFGDARRCLGRFGVPAKDVKSYMAMLEKNYG